MNRDDRQRKTIVMTISRRSGSTLQEVPRAEEAGSQWRQVCRRDEVHQPRTQIRLIGPRPPSSEIKCSYGGDGGCELANS